MLAPKLRHEQRTEIPELKTKCKTTKRSSSVEGTCSQSGCGPDFSSSRFGKVDYVLVNMRLPRTHRGPRRTRNNLLRLDIVDFQAFDWPSYQKTSGETADTFVDPKTSKCSLLLRELQGVPTPQQVKFSSDASRDCLNEISSSVFCPIQSGIKVPVTIVPRYQLEGRTLHNADWRILSHTAVKHNSVPFRRRHHCSRPGKASKHSLFLMVNREVQCRLT